MIDTKTIKIKEHIANLFLISSQLTKLTERPFTLDGHTVGSIGEVYAKLFYGIELYPPSHVGHDGIWNGREVQIKATQRNSVELKGKTDLLLVFQINTDGSFSEIYNGDGKLPWKEISHKKTTKAGGISISLSELRKLNTQVRSPDRIPRLIINSE